MTQAITHQEPARFEMDRQAREAGYHELRINDRDHRPSWKRYGKGTAQLRVSTHERNRYLSVNTLETALPSDPKGKWASKETYFTTDAEGAQAIFDMMYAAGFRPSAPEA